MIGSLKGTVSYKDLHMIVLDVGGVGYKIFVSADTALDALPGEELFLWTYLSVRENALDLFGFEDKESLETFELLIGISGIGPKTALGILNVASPMMLRQAVVNDDTSYLTKVSGIGRKTAEKIVLELKDKLVTTSADIDTHMQGAGETMEALLSLGYDERTVRDVLKKIPKEVESTSDRVKFALKLLSQHG